MSRSNVIYAGTSLVSGDNNEFSLPRGVEATVGIFGAVTGDAVQLQHLVAGEWVDTIIYGSSQQLSSTNTLIGLRGPRTFRVKRILGTTSIIVEVVYD
jgi:hypothetical protein